MKTVEEVVVSLVSDIRHECLEPWEHGIDIDRLRELLMAAITAERESAARDIIASAEHFGRIAYPERKGEP